MDRLRIRPLRDPKDYEDCVMIQREVWLHDDLDITPVHQFCISAQTGAVLLGAFVGKAMAGYVYSFPAELNGKFCLHSHHLAVLPEYQGCGIGRRLKRAQLEEAIRRGYDLITWTYDPMQARNANLNLHALGAVGRTYLDNFYGWTTALMLDVNVPTDRLLVEWQIKSKRVERKMAGKEKFLNSDKIAGALEHKPGGNYPRIWPGRPNLTLGDRRILIELPRNIKDLKPVPGLIARWQKAVRKALKHYFARGYRLDDFIFGDRSSYVLKKERSNP